MIKMIIEHHMELIKWGFSIKFRIILFYFCCSFLKLLEKTFSSYYFVDYMSLVFQKTVVLFAIISVSILSEYFIIYNFEWFFSLISYQDIF
jgi:hypothetical protein